MSAKLDATAQLIAQLPAPETRAAIIVRDAPADARRYRILTRVSDDKLRSIPQQILDCAQYVGTLGGAAFVDGVYNLGEHSGFSMTESQVYQQVLADAKAGAFHALVVRDSSRLGRDYWEKLGTLRDLRGAKVEFHVVEEGGRFDFEDRLSKVRSWASTWADEEKKREEIRKSLRATEALREMGLPTVRPPLGYRSVKDPSVGRRVWRPDGDAPKVRAIFATFLDQPTIELSALGEIHGLSGKQVSRLLTNPAYTGGYVWRGVFHAVAAEIIPPLVDPATFERARLALARRRDAGA